MIVASFSPFSLAVIIIHFNSFHFAIVDDNNDGDEDEKMDFLLIFCQPIIFFSLVDDDDVDDDDDVRSVFLFFLIGSGTEDLKV